MVETRLSSSSVPVILFASKAQLPYHVVRTQKNQSTEFTLTRFMPSNSVLLSTTKILFYYKKPPKISEI